MAMGAIGEHPQLAWRDLDGILGGVRQIGGMARSAPRHDRDAGGPADLLAAKAALRDEVWTRDAGGEGGPVPRGRRAHPELHRSRGRRRTPAQPACLAGGRDGEANPDSAQWPVRQRALEDGKTVYMAVPRLAEPEPFFALDPAHLREPPRKAASISGATRSARRVTLADLSPVDLVVMGCVAAGEDGARLGKGGGFADLEFALATVAGLIGPQAVCVTTVHELQVRPAGTIPLTDHDVPVDFIITPNGSSNAACRAAPGRRHLLGRPDRGKDHGHPAAGRAAGSRIRAAVTGLAPDEMNGPPSLAGMTVGELP